MSENNIENTNKKARLGRGLGSLLGEHAPNRDPINSRPAMPTPSRPEPPSAPEKKAPEPIKQQTRHAQEVTSRPEVKFQIPSTAIIAKKTSEEDAIANIEKQKQTFHGGGLGTVSTNPPNLGVNQPLQVQSAPQGPADQSKVWRAPIDKLKPSQLQPRERFDKEKLEELAQSIKSAGLLQPIITRRKANGEFEIVAGERRWRAAQLAGLHEVPIIVKDFDDKKTLEVAIIENVQRENLNPMEEAEAYARLANEFKLTQQQVAEKVGKDRVTIANAIRLLQLTNDVREMIRQGNLTSGHAKVLLSVDDPISQSRLARMVIDKKLSVRRLESVIKDEIKEMREKNLEDFKLPGITEKLILNINEEIQKALGTKVNIEYHKGKGKIQIHFYSDDELTQIADRLKKQK